MNTWFRIHLVTALILMLLASGLLWLNMRSTPFEYSRMIEHQGVGNTFFTRGDFLGDSYGWPIVCCWVEDGQATWNQKDAISNGILALALLALTAIACEGLIARPSKTKTLNDSAD